MRETKNKLHLWQGWEKSLRQTSGGSHLMQNTVETTINNSRRKHSRVYFRINCCSETAQRLTKFYASVPSDFLRCSNNPFQLLCFKNDSWPFGDIWVKQMGLCVYPHRRAHIDTLTCSSRGRHLHNYPIRNYIQGPLPTRTWVGKVCGRGGEAIFLAELTGQGQNPGELLEFPCRYW